MAGRRMGWWYVENALEMIPCLNYVHVKVVKRKAMNKEFLMDGVPAKRKGTSQRRRGVPVHLAVHKIKMSQERRKRFLKAGKMFLKEGR